MPAAADRAVRAHHGRGSTASHSNRASLGLRSQPTRERRSSTSRSRIDGSACRSCRSACGIPYASSRHKLWLSSSPCGVCPDEGCDSHLSPSLKRHNAIATDNGRQRHSSPRSLERDSTGAQAASSRGAAARPERKPAHWPHDIIIDRGDLRKAWSSARIVMITVAAPTLHCARTRTNAHSRTPDRDTLADVMA